MPLIEIRHPKFFDIRSFDDDYISQSPRRLHLFEPVDPVPVIYLPRIHFAPDVYVEERYPYAYNRFEEPVNPPYLSRLLTTLSLTYKTKVLPVRDYVAENKETDEDSLASASETAPPEVKKPGNGSKVTTPKNDSKVGTNTSTPPESVKVTPKPNVKAESVTKPKAETNPKAEAKPKEEAKPEADTKPESVKTTEPDANVAVTDASDIESKFDVDSKATENSKVEDKDAPTAAASESSVSETKSDAKENAGEETTVADVPTP